MKVFKFRTGRWHKEQFNNSHIIIDTLLSNDISLDWDYTKGKVICVGFIYKDNVNVYLAESENDEELKTSIRKYLVLNSGADLYSFNKDMETGNFKGMWDILVHIKEIKPFRAKGWNRDRFYNELILKKQIDDVGIYDPYGSDSIRSVRDYAMYNRTGQIEYALKVVQHNISCLLKESVILNHRQYFLDNYPINERGWLIDN